MGKQENVYIIFLFLGWNTSYYAGVEEELKLELESIFSDRSRSWDGLKFVHSTASMTRAGRGQDKLENMVEDKIQGREDRKKAST